MNKKKLITMSVLSAVIASQAMLCNPITAQAATTTVNVKKYGAKGNDTNPDSDAIQKAVNVATTRAGTTVVVAIPGGTYYINKKIVVPSNVVIKMSANTVLKRTVDDYFFVNYVKKYDGINNDYNNTSNVTIQGGTFEGCGYPRGVVNFWNAQKISFNSVNFNNIDGTSHVLLMNGINNLTVSGCSFKNCCTNHINSEVIHTDFIEKGFEGAVKNIPCKNVYINHNNFYNVPSAIGTHHNNDSRAYNIQVNNNSFYNVKYCCVDAPSFESLTMLNNTAVNSGSLVKGAEGVNFKVRNNTISASNSIYKLKGVSYRLYPVHLSRCKSLTFSQNNITGCNYYKYCISKSTGVSIDGKRVNATNYYKV